MITASVLEIRDQLSHYLQYVRNGERIGIIEENHIIAEISMPESTVRPEAKTNIPAEQYRRLVASGRIIPAKSHELLEKPTISDLDKQIDWVTVYNENRADRL
jgi:antitoxin (DNA-binding transcriptional repressor) of toxin-antitoxin stability system